jgi:hypothetical protein
MNPRRQSLIALLAAAFVLMAATPALGAGSANPVIADCLAHPGGLTGHYTVAQLKNALQVMPAETKEYTSCPDVINRALLAAVGTSGTGTGGSSGGGSSSFLPTPVIVILVLLILAAVTFGALAVRRRQAVDGGATGRGAGPSVTGTGAGPVPASGAGPAGPGPTDPSEPADEDLTGPR